MACAGAVNLIMFSCHESQPKKCQTRPPCASGPRVRLAKWKMKVPNNVGPVLLEEAEQTIERLVQFNSGPRIDMVVCDRSARTRTHAALSCFVRINSARLRTGVLLTCDG